MIGRATLTEAQVPFAGRVVASIGDPETVPHSFDPRSRVLTVHGIDDATLADRVARFAVRPPASEADVANEMRRRQMAIYGVTSTGGLADARLADAEAYDVALINSDADRLSEITARQSRLQALTVKAGLLITMQPIPEDYTADKWWN